MRHCMLAVALFCASHTHAAHPLISELLFNVPNDPAADPNLDGTRDAAGDEFIELHNPTDKPMALKGYALRNRLTWADPTVKRGVSFTFPDFTLPPNATVVVFNGYNTTFSGPVGTPDTAPTATNPDFDNAYIFTMSNTNRTNAFRNSADFVVLVAPDGEPVSCIHWGKQEGEPPDAADTHEVTAEPKGSVQRAKADAPPAPRANDTAPLSTPGTVPWTTNPKPNPER